MDTDIGATQPELDTLQDAVTSILGSGVEIATEAPIKVVTRDEGLVIELPASGLTSGQKAAGELNATLGNLTLDTMAGQGTATINLGGDLSVEGSANLVVTDEGIDVVIEDARLRLQPEAPDATLLEGGSESVTQVGVDFQVELNNLPNGASLSVQFSKDASAFLDSPGTTFQLAAQEVGGTIENETEDVAFSVNVTESGITNQDLGDNTVAMAASKAWYDQMLAEGKVIVITKIDDSGNVYTAVATCVVSGDVVNCIADFTGSAGGFSVFSLLAIVPGPETLATPTSTPIATPTPTPTRTPVPPTLTPTSALVPPPTTPRPTPVPPTSTPTPTLVPPTPTPTTTAALVPTSTPSIALGGGGAPVIPIVIGAVALLIAAGGGYYLLVMRRGSAGA